MNRTSAFFRTAAWLLAIVAGGAAGGLVSTPGLESVTWPGLTPSAWAIALLVLGALALLFSRSRVVLRTGARGAGWPGLARWVSHGLLAGFLSVALAFWLERLPPTENGWLRLILAPLDALVPAGVFVLFFGLIFRRWPWSGSIEGQPGWDVMDLLHDFRTAGWLMMLCGLLMTLAGAAGLFAAYKQGLLIDRISAGALLTGLAMILLGLLTGPFQRSTRWSRPLTIALVVTGLPGILLMTAGMFFSK